MRGQKGGGISWASPLGRECRVTLDYTWIGGRSKGGFALGIRHPAPPYTAQSEPHRQRSRLAFLRCLGVSGPVLPPRERHRFSAAPLLEARRVRLTFPRPGSAYA